MRERAKTRSANVTAVLGPTNTGKTHFALERMMAHSSGIIGLPLRLLAREVYGRLVDKVGVNQVALVTGEEKIKPKHPRFWVATVEAMPRDLDVAFVAIDEIQIAGSLDRGHVFTDRLLNRRGREETLVIGAGSMERAVRQLLPHAHVVTRPRLSKLSFAGDKKLSRLPRRSAIVAFSTDEVYAIAELIRRQRGGAAVVMGALSPRTRNAQVALYQNGDVDYLVATDAIGMGLNLDLDHVAFASDRKFDGWQFRRLTPAEFGQIAGRAGRHLRDGTFGSTGRCPPFDEDLIEAIEDHRFDPVGPLQWRNSDLDFATIGDLQASLDRVPTEEGLTRAPVAEDVLVLDIASRDPDVQRQVKTRADVARLWEACQIPDYRKVSPSAHAELVLALFGFIVRAGRIPDAWFQTQLSPYDRTDGDIDVLSNRIAQVRTLSFIANRPDWLGDPEHWQGVTRQIEDRLSDALHERLAQRFVDRRTSVLMRRLRENAMLEAEVTSGGDVLVEGEHVGQLHGFRFTPDPQATGDAARALNAAALKGLATEIETRANRFAESVDESIALANDGTLRWLGDPIGKLVAGDKLLQPRARLLADEHLTGPALETVQRRIDLWLAAHVKKLLGPLLDLDAGEELEGMARGLAFQVAEALGVLERSRVAEEVKGLDQAARATLRKLGFRFGAYHIYLPALLKPAPRALASQLWALRQGGVESVRGLEEVPYLAASGRTSFPADSAVPKGLYRAAGFRVCGARAVRVDILERLADLIRPAIAYRPGTTPGTPPPGTADQDGFVTTVAMTSLAGCSGEDFASILRSLGYVVDRRAGPPITVPLVEAAPTQPLQPRPATEAVAEHTDAPAEIAGATAAEGGNEPSAPEPPATEAIAEHPDALVDVDAAIPAEGGGEPSAPEPPADEPPSTVPEPPLEEPPLPDDEPLTPPEDEPTPIGDPSEPENAPAPMEMAQPDDGTGVDTAREEPAADEAAEPHRATFAPSEPDESEAEASSAAEPAASDVIIEESLLPEGAPEPVAAADPAAPVLIDVWRPHRASHHAQRRPDRAGGRPHRRGQEQRGGAARAPVEAPQGDASPVAAAAEGGVAAETGSPVRSGRPERDQHRRRPFDKRPPAGGGREGDRNRPAPQGAPEGSKRPAFDQRRERGPRQHDRNEGQRGSPGTWSSSERPQRDRQPDPNSPFAKLAALKADLEARSKKDP